MLYDYAIVYKTSVWDIKSLNAIIYYEVFIILYTLRTVRININTSALFRTM